jgi:hypothetical protein
MSAADPEPLARAGIAGKAIAAREGRRAENASLVKVTVF